MSRPNRLYGIQRSKRHGEAAASPTTEIARNLLRRWLSGPDEKVQRGRLQLESLERRQLMAGDVDLFASDGVDPAATTVAADVATSTGSDAGPTHFVTTTAAEGEAAPDLVAFAELLGQLNVKFYGADWCPACTEQKELFSDGKDNLPFIEVTEDDRTLNQVGRDNNITQYPTWEFPSGQRLTGLQSLNSLATAAGVSIPVSDTPSFETIGDQTVGIGSPLHVVVDAYDPGDGPVSTSVTVADPSLVEATVITGNRSIRINVDNYGTMVFEMFEGRAPRTTGQILQLIENGFYDAQPNGDEIIFHRVVDGFVLQAGDPTGTGTSGSTLPDVDDEFHPDLQHNREGIFSFAKAGDDTNNSQFFITEVPTRTLDFNHSVMGQLVEGFDVREAISRVETERDSLGRDTGRPVTPIRINSIEIFEDTENALVMLKPISGQTGATTATFTVTDADGNTSSETIDVFVVEDSATVANAQPYLGDIARPAATENTTSAQLQLTSIDIEGDPVRYSAFDRTSGVNVAVSADPNTGLVTVTPPAGFVGTAQVEMRVQWVTPAFENQFDSQLVEFEFIDATTPDTLVFETGRNAFVGNTYTNDVNLSGGDETGVAYTLVNPPAGATIDSATGVISFTPTSSQVGDVVLAVSATRGGNVVDTGSITVDVRTSAASYDVELTNIDGTPVTSLSPGQEFFATLVVRDDRSFPADIGVFAAAADLLFDPAVVRPVAGESIAFLSPLDDLNGGTVGDGIIDNVRGVSPSTRATEQKVSPFARIRFEAVGSGTTTLQTASAADAEDTLLFDVDERILSSQIAYNAATVTVSSNLIINADTFTVAEDSAATTLDVLANDTQTGSSGSLSVTSVTQPTSGGSVVLDGGNVRFTPAADFNGSVTFTYTAETGVGEQGTATVTVDVTAVNDPPVAVDDNFSVGTNQASRTLAVLDNDTFAPDAGETLTVTAVTTPASGGTATISSDGTAIVYTPPTASTATVDTFTYTISDGTTTATATVTVDLDAVPTAADDSFTLDEDTNDSFDPLANDVADPDGQTFTITAVTTPSAGGVATIVDGGTRISYTPAANFSGTEAIDYTITDTGGGESTATITFNVTAVNDAPPAGTFDRNVVRLSDSSLEQTVLRISDLAANVDQGETIRFTSASLGNASTGTVRVSPEGTEIIFVPSASTAAAATDTITFITDDGNGLTSTGTIAITVNDYQLRTISVAFDGGNGRTANYAITEEARLEGTTIDGNTVALTAQRSADGSLNFGDLAPGTYEVVVPANPFLQGRESEQRIAVQSDVDDGDAMVTPVGGLLRPEYLSVQDFLGSTSRRSVLVAVQPGSSSTLTLASNTPDVEQISGALDADGQQLTLSGIDPAATDNATQNLSTTLPVRGDARVQTRGRVGDMALYRIDLDDASGMFATASTAAGATSAAGTSAAGTSLAGSAGGDDTAGGTNDLDQLLADAALDGDGVTTDVNDAAISDVFGDG